MLTTILRKKQWVLWSCWLTCLLVAVTTSDGAEDTNRWTSKHQAKVPRICREIQWKSLSPESSEAILASRIALPKVSQQTAGPSEFGGIDSDHRLKCGMNGNHQPCVGSFSTSPQNPAVRMLGGSRALGMRGPKTLSGFYRGQIPTTHLAWQEKTGLSSTFPQEVNQRPKKLPATSTMIRLLAYNIKHGRGNDGRVDLQRTADVIRRVRADVVALQEVDKKVERSGQLNEAKRLAELTGLPYHAFGSFFDYQGGEYGMAIISRYPLRDIKRLRLPDGAEPRASLIVTVAAQKSFRLANVHFYRDERERLAQAQALLKYLQNEKLPSVIAGDFNSRPKSAVLKLFADWNIPDKGEDHFTFPSDRPRVEIDFLMFRPENAFVVNEVDVVKESLASDHRPVLMEVSFGETNK